MQIVFNLFACLRQFKKSVFPSVVKLFDFVIVLLFQIFKLVNLTARSFSSIIVRFFSKMAFSLNSLMLSFTISACSKFPVSVASFSISFNCLLIKLYICWSIPSKVSPPKIFSKFCFGDICKFFLFPFPSYKLNLSRERVNCSIFFCVATVPCLLCMILLN